MAEIKINPDANSTPVKKIKLREPIIRIEKEQVFRVYVWELPVRLFHWVNAFCIMVLIATGFFIGRPVASPTLPGDAYYSFFMGWIRYIHFFAAFLFTFNLLARWYWVFAGNKHSTSNPLRHEFLIGVVETVKSYLFLKNKKRHYIGHNPLAQLAYWFFIGVGSIVMIFTGFYMYFEPQPESFWGKLFSWVPNIFGNSFLIRSWHHITMWGFIIFIFVHIYMSWREDYLARNGTMSSIFTGYKNETKHAVEDDEGKK